MDIRIFESKALSAVTGVDMDVEALWKAGERIYNLQRAIMVKRENRTREDDTLYEPWFKMRWPEEDMGFPVGPLDKDKFEALRDRYYELRGWDVKTGRPTRAKLEELDLKDAANDLETAGKLP